MITLKKTCALTLLSLVVATASAQDYVAAVQRNEFTFYTFGGLSTLRYKSDELSVTPGMGGGFGINYALCFDEHVAFVTGVELAQFRAVAKANTISSGQNFPAAQVGMATSDSRYDMFFYSDFVNYQENQRATYIHVPLLWRLSIPLASSPLYKFYAAAGAKVGFAVSGDIEVQADELTTYAYFPYFDQTFYNRPEHQLSTGSLKKQNGSFDLTYDIMLSVDAGILRILRNKWEVCVGFYFDYGYIDVSHRTYDGLVGYKDNNSLVFNSVLTSKYNRMATPESAPTSYAYVSRTSLMAGGLKLKILFGKKPSVNIFVRPVPVYDPNTDSPN